MHARARALIRLFETILRLKFERAALNGHKSNANVVTRFQHIATCVYSCLEILRCIPNILKTFCCVNLTCHYFDSNLT